MDFDHLLVASGSSSDELFCFLSFWLLPLIITRALPLPLRSLTEGSFLNNIYSLAHLQRLIPDMSTFPIDINMVLDDIEQDDEYDLENEFEVVVPQDDNLDDDATWKEIDIPSIDSSMILEAGAESTSLVEPIDGDVPVLEERFFPFLFGFCLHALRKNIAITV